MLKNFLLISLRSIVKNKGGAYLNLLGLTFGMAACLYIFNYVFFELTYDSSETDKSIVRVETHNYDGEILTNKSAFTSSGAGEVLSTWEGVHSHTVLRPFSEEGSALFRLPTSDTTSRKLYVKTAYVAEPSIFDVFSLKMLVGSGVHIQESSNSIYLSNSTAEDFIEKAGLEQADIIGKELKSGGKGLLDDTYIVRGVFEDRPTNTHLPFDVLILTPPKDGLTIKGTASAEDSYTYLRISPNQKLASILPKETKAHGKQFFLRPIGEIHRSDEISNEPTPAANTALLLFLSLIGFVIMLLACTNYINNAIINSIYRAKEIGIRKVLGIRPTQLIVTFIGEALILNILAAVLGLVLYQLGMQLTAQWTSIDFLVSNELSTSSGLLFLSLLLLLSTLLSSLYPSYYLSSLHPIAALRSKINMMDSDQMGGANSIIKSLLVFQLAASIVFVSSVYIVFKQLNHLENKEKQPFDFRISGVFPGASGAGELFGKLAIGFIEELEKGGLFQDAHLSNLSKGDIRTAQTISLLRADDPHFDANGNTFSFYVIDFSFWGRNTDRFLAGRNFNIAFGTDPNNLIVNEAAMKQLGYDKADSVLGKELRTKGGVKTVIGVVENETPGESPSVYATGLRFRTFIDLTMNYPGSAGESVSDYIDKVEHLLGSRLPFLYLFDRGYQQQRKVERSMLGLFSFFAILAITISTIGMVGLSFFVTQKRSKEIGIRKILGAPTSNILIVLLLDFLKLIFGAALFAIPTVILGSKVWLDNYAYRISIDPTVIGLPLLLILLICLSVILRKCLTAASVSPVRILQD